jgi:hypothetical protein
MVFHNNLKEAKGRGIFVRIILQLYVVSPQHNVTFKRDYHSRTSTKKNYILKFYCAAALTQSTQKYPINGRSATFIP